MGCADGRGVPPAGAGRGQRRRHRRTGQFPAHRRIPRVHGRIARRRAGLPGAGHAHVVRPDGVGTVLVVEDEPALAETVQYTLEREGFKVLMAADGNRALERFRADRPALVLLDLMLPELSGLDVLRIMRDESTVPIVIMTAKDS